MTSNDQNNFLPTNPTKTDDLKSVLIPKPIGKESEEGLVAVEGEKLSIIEIKEPQPPSELKKWVQKLEGPEVNLAKPVKDDYGQVLLTSASGNRPKIQLPLTEEGVKIGLKQTVVSSFRWLAEWCLRLFKMWPGRTEYRKQVFNS